MRPFANDDEFNANPPTEPWNAESHPPLPQAVESHGKIFMVWAQLKSLRSNRDIHPTSKPEFQLLTQALKDKNLFISREDAKGMENSRPVSKVTVSTSIKARENTKIPKYVTKSLKLINPAKVSKTNMNHLKSLSH